MKYKRKKQLNLVTKTVRTSYLFQTETQVLNIFYIFCSTSHTNCNSTISTTARLLHLV